VLLTVVMTGSSIPSAALVAFANAAPDLITKTVAAPSNVSPGAVFDATDAIRNGGTAGSRSSVTRYYFSRDAVKSSGDVRSTGSRSIPMLTVGSESHGVAKLAVPSTLVPGTYTLFGCADDTRLVAEDNEVNNCTAAASLVTVSLAEWPKALTGCWPAPTDQLTVQFVGESGQVLYVRTLTKAP
jgi:hypothetical protein